MITHTCPACGHNAILTETSDDHSQKWYTIYCTHCDIGFAHADPKMVIGVWHGLYP